MRKLFFILLTAAAVPAAFAQQTKVDKQKNTPTKINTSINTEEEGVNNYRKHTAFGLKLANDGYGFFVEVGRAQSLKKSLLFQLDISEKKHTKEDKQSNTTYSGPGLIFGKINFFYPVKLGLQQQVLLGNKSNKNGISVTANYGGGISLGLLRPYFLEITDTSKSPYQRKFIRYESADSSLFSNNENLVYFQATGPNLSRGWNKLSFTPGLYAKAALRFDYGRYNESVSAIEVGGTAEFYAKKVPQLVFSAPKNLFVNIYIAIVFGKRK